MLSANASIRRPDLQTKRLIRGNMVTPISRRPSVSDGSDIEMESQKNAEIDGADTNLDEVIKAHQTFQKSLSEVIAILDKMDEAVCKELSDRNLEPKFGSESSDSTDSEMSIDSETERGGEFLSKSGITIGQSVTSDNETDQAEKPLSASDLLLIQGPGSDSEIDIREEEEVDLDYLEASTIALHASVLRILDEAEPLVKEICENVQKIKAQKREYQIQQI